MHRLFQLSQNCTNFVRINLLSKKYLASGRRPWTPGYKEYKEVFLSKVLSDEDLLELFRQEEDLPSRYGCRIDERVVEYPWVMTRLRPGAGVLLDAGSALNHGYLVTHGILKEKKMIIYTLSPEETIKSADISYIYGDLRKTILRDNSFDEIVCVSTLEHVGMDNTLLYAKDGRFKEKQASDYLQVVAELRRLLRPGGKLLITVPFGRYEDFGWQQQFDQPMVGAIINTFAGSYSHIVYYQYGNEGWQLSSAEASARCVYFDIHRQADYDSDFAAAARAVACLELVK